MRKVKIEYDSKLDALIAITKRLSKYEEKYRFQSEEFFDRYSKGTLEDSVDFVEWANDYQHYTTLRRELEKQLRHVA